MAHNVPGVGPLQAGRRAAPQAWEHPAVSEPALPLITITPEPAPEELAAIVAAVTAAILREGTRALPYESGAGSSRWSRQGRHEAMRGLDRDPGATSLLPGRGR